VILGVCADPCAFVGRHAQYVDAVGGDGVAGESGQVSREGEQRVSTGHQGRSEWFRWASVRGGGGHDFRGRPSGGRSGEHADGDDARHCADADRGLHLAVLGCSAYRREQWAEADEGKQAGDGSASLEEGRAQVGACLAFEEMFAGVYCELPTTFSSGEGEQYGPTVVGGEFDVTEDEEKFEAQARAGPSEADGDAASRAAVGGGERRGGYSVDLVGEENPTVVGIETLQGGRQRVGLLALQGEFFGTVEPGVFDEAVNVVSVRGLAPEMVGDDVAGGNDRVGLERAVFEPFLGCGDPDKRRLHEILAVVLISDPRRDDAPHRSGRLDNVRGRRPSGGHGPNRTHAGF
jgi:hypothetical protein